MRKILASVFTPIIVMAIFYMVGGVNNAQASVVFDIQGAQGSASGNNWYVTSAASVSSNATLYFSTCYHNTTTNGATSTVAIYNTAGSVLYYANDGGQKQSSSGQTCRSGSLSPFNGGVVSATSYSVRYTWPFGGQNGSLSLQSGDYFTAVTDPSELTLTRFISTTPVNGTTTATSTTIGAHVYINSNDYATGTVLRMTFRNNTVQNGVGGSVLDAWNSAFSDIELPLVSGDNTVSTSTVFTAQGLTYANYSIYTPSTVPLIGWALTGTTLVSTSTSFTVVQKTALDIAMSSTSAALISALTTGTTTNNYLSACDIGFGFDLSYCLIGLVLPDSATLKSDMEQFRDDFLVKWPMGYVTRFYTILSSSTPVTPPSIVVPLFGTTLDLTPWDKLMGTSSILATASSSIVNPVSGVVVGDGKTLRQSTETYWNIVWYILLGLAIIHDVVGVGRSKIKHL